MQLNFKGLKIEIRTFYLVGAILMVFSMIGSIWALNTNWGILVTGAKMSAVVGILFNLLWCGLFTFLYKMTPKQPDKVVNDPEIDKLLQELRLEDKKGGTNVKNNIKNSD
jgi:hypothetical protein